ncbi:MAG: hypothetical protein JWM37_201 [Candidatus Saccharibacteria bacterium]|nr:hypothetical protein [Candidatus Saccharibacteria bacterium]
MSTETAPQPIPPEEQLPPPNYEDQAELEKHLSLQIVDVSRGVVENSVDHADAYIGEQTTQRGFKGFLKKIWHGNIARDFIRQREIQRGRNEIMESDNLYALQGGTEQDHDQAMSAVVERFTHEYATLHDGEYNESMDETDHGAELHDGLKSLVKQYADGSMGAEDLREARTRLLNEYGRGLKQEDRNKGLLFADNILKVAEHAKAAAAHGIGLDRIETALTGRTGEARVGVRTEAQETRTDRLVNKLYSTKAGSLVNETTIAVAAGVAISASKWTTQKAITALGYTVGMGVGAGVIAGAREHARMGQERRQHMRQMAEGQDVPLDSKKRQKLEDTRYETVSALDLTAAIEAATASLDASRHESVRSLLGSLTEAHTRVRKSDEEAIDLLQYSSKFAVESERLGLDIAAAKGRVAFKKALEALSDADMASLGFESRDPDDIYDQDEARLEEALNPDLNDRDRLFNKIRRQETLKMAAVATVSAVVVGTAIQEVRSVFSDSLQGVFEGSDNQQDRRTLLAGLFNHGHFEAGGVGPTGSVQEISANAGTQLPDGYHLGPVDGGSADLLDADNNVVTALHFGEDGHLTDGSVDALKDHGFNLAETTQQYDTTTTTTEDIPRTPDEYMSAHPDQFTAIHRELWYDNDTSAYDQNELLLDWGGANGTGMDEHGNYVFNVNSMLQDGSFAEGQSTDAHNMIVNGQMKIALSVTEGTQSHVYMVDVDANGNAVIDPNSYIGQSLFENRDGQTHFVGAFAEAVQVTGQASDGGTNVRMLATVVGEGQPNPGVDHVETTQVTHHERIVSALSAPAERELPVEVPFVLPVYGRRGLEQSPAAERPVIEAGYYGYGRQTPEEWAQERSPRLLENPDAVLNPREELDFYRDELARRRGDDYVAEIDDNIRQSQELGGLNKDSRLLVVMPVAGVAEADNIFKTLSLYAKQDEEALKQTTLLLNVNWIDDSEQDPTKQAAIEKTMAEIERARQTYPSLNIATFTKVWTRDWVDNVRKGKMYGEVIKTLYDTAAMSVQQAMANGQIDSDQDLLMVTNDADAQGMHSQYLKNYIKAEERNKDSDAFVGLIRWGSKEADRFPGYSIATSVMQVMNLVSTRNNNGYKVQPATIGPNSAFRMSAYAAVGGCVDRNDAGAGADSELGRKILAARGFQIRNGQSPAYDPGYTSGRTASRPAGSKPRTVIKHVAGTDIDSSADRLLTAYREGKFIPQAWGQFDQGGYQPRGQKTGGRLFKPENALGVRNRFKSTRSRVEFQVSNFVTHWYPDQALATWGLSALFPQVDGKPAWTLERKTVSNDEGHTWDEYAFEFTPEGAAWLRGRLARDSQGRGYAARMRNRLYEKTPAQLVRPS